MDGLALGEQALTLADAETVLLVDDGQVQGVEIDAFLKHRMGAEHDQRVPRSDGGALVLARAALVAACHDDGGNA